MELQKGKGEDAGKRDGRKSNEEKKKKRNTTNVKKRIGLLIGFHPVYQHSFRGGMTH